MIRVLPLLGTFFICAAIAISMIRPGDQMPTAPRQPLLIEPSRFESTVSVSSSQPDSSSKLAGDSLSPLDRSDHSLSPGRIDSVPLAEVHDVFFTPGDVVTGRRANLQPASDRAPAAPRMQTNPFAP